MPSNRRLLPVGASGPIYYKFQDPASNKVWQYNSTNSQMELVDPSAVTLSGISDGLAIENVNGTATGIPVDRTVCGRATLTTGTPVADASAQTSVFWTPYKGNVVTLFDGTRDIPVTFTEQTFKLTDSSQTGGSISSATITGLTDTSKLFAGMKLSASTGTGTLAANTTISTIASATSVTVNNPASVNGTLTNLTFKMPASSNIDVFGVYSSGALVLRPGTLWTNQTTRSDTVAIANDGRQFNTTAVRATQSNTIAANAGLLLFTIATNGTDGQTDDSGGSGATAGSRLLLNWYNRVARAIQCCPGYVDDNANTSYTTTSTTWVTANSGTGATFKCLASGEDAASFVLSGLAFNSGAGGSRAGIGINSTSGPTVMASTNSTGANGIACAVGTALPLGLNSISLLITVSSGTGTYFADLARAGASADPLGTGIFGTILA